MEINTKITQPGIKADGIWIYDCEVELNNNLWIDFINNEINEIVATIHFSNITKEQSKQIINNVRKEFGEIIIPQ